METPKTSAAVALLITIIAGGMFVVGKYVERQDYSPVTISVQGLGEVSAAPDIAELTFGVETLRQATAEKAMGILADKMNAIMETIKKEGIEEKDISTQSLSLSPAYDWDEGKRIDRGFEASQNLRVKVRDLSNIGQILTAATNAGANQAGGVSFTIDDPEILKATARQEAIVNAEEKAIALAAQLGKSLGKLKGFSEGGGAVSVKRFDSNVMMEADAVGGGSVPIPAGEQEVVVNVNMTYELE